MQDPLSQLRDLHVPAEPPFWPPAPGWWLVVLAFLALTAVTAWLLHRRYRHGAARRFARAELDSLSAAYTAGSLTALAYVDAANALVKRLLIASGHQAAGPLSGPAWLDYLDHLTGGTSFAGGAGAVLGNARYETHPDLDARELHQLLVNVTDQLPNAGPVR